MRRPPEPSCRFQAESRRWGGPSGTWGKRFLEVWMVGSLIVSQPGWAASTLAFNWRLGTASPSGLTIEVCSGSQVLLRLPSQDREWAETWAQRLMERLDRLAQRETRGRDWILKPQSDGWLLEARGLPFLTITEALARKLQTSPQALGQAWLKNLQKTFDRPYLALPQQEILVPPGATVEVPVSSTASGEWKGTLEGTGCSRVQLRQSQRQLIVEGLKPGREGFTLSCGGLELRVFILVRLWAGWVRLPVIATVTGQAPPADFLGEAIRNALTHAAEVQPGSSLEVGPLPSLSSPGGPGSTLQAQVPVKISGRDYVPFTATVPVTVRNHPWAPREAEQLIVSNDPENVSQPGLLAQGRLIPQQANRLLYHHKNVSSEPLFWGVYLVNPTDRWAQVHVQHNVFGPNRDEIYVGHLVTAAFWRDRLQGNGYQVQVPPRSGWPLLNRRVGPQGVISGLAEITPQPEEPLLCQVFADRNPRSQPWNLPARNPEGGGLVCRRPSKFQEATYSVGGHHTFISIGKEPLISLSNRPLAGNYGVLYHVQLTLTNPTAQEASIEIALAADGGVARGVVIIEGQICETGLVLASAEERLQRITLPPHGKRRLRLQIMPQAGSHYPLRLVVRPAGRG